MHAILLTTRTFKVCSVSSSAVTVTQLVSQVLVVRFQVTDELLDSRGDALCGQGGQELGALFNLAAYYNIVLPSCGTAALPPANADEPSGTGSVGNLQRIG